MDAVEVELEVNETGPANSSGEMQAVTVIVGLPDTAVRESRDRVWTAIANSGFPGSAGGRTTVNPAPADLKKEGPSFDLPMALGIVANRVDGFDRSVFKRCTIVGELAAANYLVVCTVCKAAVIKADWYDPVPEQQIEQKLPGCLHVPASPTSYLFNKILRSFAFCYLLSRYEIAAFRRLLRHRVSPRLRSRVVPQTR